MNKLRTYLFDFLFYVWTGSLALIGLILLFFPRRALEFFIHVWARVVRLMERTILGITYEVKGLENVPQGPCLIAAKHQSVWETYKLYLTLGNPAVVMKTEINSVPLLKWYSDKTGMIPIDRSGRAKTLTRMMKAAHQAVSDNRQIVIFPQGTRLKPFDKKPYKVGVAALYQELQLPIVPMALNSGMFWPKDRNLRRPGHITVEFLPPIPAGLQRAEMMKRLEEDLESASDRLCKEASK